MLREPHLSATHAAPSANNYPIGQTDEPAPGNGRGLLVQPLPLGLVALLIGRQLGPNAPPHTPPPVTCRLPLGKLPLTPTLHAFRRFPLPTSMANQ